MVKKARYLKVKEYYKSSEQYWKERNRRKLVLKLREEEYLTVAQIASKTWGEREAVKRDLKKLKPYHERMVHHYRDVLRKHQDAMGGRVSWKKRY